ncbi:hypothetical protein A3F52_05430 [Candidatus Uhrbacteria bacterium RIFCSPHIGHO2_12_FULL_47_11]|nr:MAG: hypothetical protein A2753_00855 [Candidatus Uhrbacteria bacterium RIFCSPHIGHO2_01_FULL_47_11]OGL75453.1 MAG: hypothetical protein A3F52_05430 [Candidatus Uhrbacteria bacterium RIFCSPHIGHO2_12_FULL_47_11]
MIFYRKSCSLTTTNKEEEKMKHLTVAFYGIAPLLLQGCYAMDNDGMKFDDDFAELCGWLGIIMFCIAVFGKSKSGGLAFAGVILILA